MGVFVKIEKKKGKCGHCGTKAKTLFTVHGITYAQECFKKLFTEKSDLDKLKREFDEKTMWVLLTGEGLKNQLMRLVCCHLSKKDKWLGLVGIENIHETHMQEIFEKQHDARTYAIQRLGQFMEDEGYTKISIMSSDYSEVVAA